MSFLIHPNFWGLFYPLQSNHKYHIYITNHNQWSEDNKCRIESNFDVNTDPFFCILLLCYKQLPTNQLTLSHYFLQSAQIYNYTCVWWSVGLVMVGRIQMTFAGQWGMILPIIKYLNGFINDDDKVSWNWPQAKTWMLRKYLVLLHL